MRFRSPFFADKPDSLRGAQPGDPVVTCGQPVFVQLVRDEPVTEGGIIGVDADHGVDQVRVFPVPLRAGVSAPLVKGLLREAQHPAGRRDGDVLGGEFTDQRMDHFGRTSRAK
ncbi:hypothetical protein GCM10027451_27930 [Geodermatophilus aquaeductus]